MTNVFEQFEIEFVCKCHRFTSNSNSFYFFLSLFCSFVSNISKIFTIFSWILNVLNKRYTKIYIQSSQYHVAKLWNRNKRMFSNLSWTLTQYKNYFLAWNARFSNKFDFETIYSVFRLRIFEIRRKFEKIFKLIVWLSYDLLYKVNNWIENIAQYCVCFCQLQLFHALTRAKF